MIKIYINYIMDNKHSMVTRSQLKNSKNKNSSLNKINKINNHINDNYDNGNDNNEANNEDDNSNDEYNDNNLEYNISDKLLLDREIKKINRNRNKNRNKDKDILVNEILSTLLPTVQNKNIELLISSNNVQSDNRLDNDLDYESDISDEYYSSMDEYDDEYDELLCQDYINNEEDSFEYFHKLNKDDKVICLKELKEINKLNESNIPLKFKILRSKMDIKTKSLAINNIEKYLNTEISNGEFIKMEQWINGLIKIPFGIYKELSINNNDSTKIKQAYFKKVKTILDNSLYGHSEAKTQILQIIGKWIKEPLSNGNILALQGPMGNGKTTLVKEGISKALDRPFVFIALGGASDSSFFDGHNFTYEGSKWGRIIDILIQCKCMNPIIYFDELDKVSETHKGEEIIHLLTHLTDSSQNNCFHDNYFTGIDFDLSKVLFIFSFNDESKINPILKDRMNVINTKGFNTEDKIKISNEYLLPEILKVYKYENKVIFDTEIITYIIKQYTNNEEGVRNLKRCLDDIVSKINMYDLLFDKHTRDSELKIPYKLNNFKIPYKITIEDIDNLLKKKTSYNPPEHMYM